jgi:opacity protein-like surface antigen
MKKFLYTFFIIFASLYSLHAEEPHQPAEKARGFFLAFGVGPRIPISYFSNFSDLGYGLDVDVSYTDNEYLPFFVFARIGFDQFPGSQSLYETSDYTNYSVTSIPIKFGLRYYFPPFINELPLILPVVEASVSYGFFQKLHQFKSSSLKSNYTEDISKFGFSLSAGVSMFLLEIIGTYNYYQTNQSLGVDLKVRLPLFITY